MAQKHTIGQLEIRKHILEERTDKENLNIIKKIQRKINKLKNKIWAWKIWNKEIIFLLINRR